MHRAIPADPLNLWEVTQHRALQVVAEVVSEAPLTIVVNGQRWVTLMCTPLHLDWLVAGFLSAEGVISGIEDIADLTIHPEAGLADVTLRVPVELPQERVLTSGCTGGTTFVDLAAAHAPIETDLRMSPALVSHLMRDLQRAATLYHRARGIHCSGLSDGEKLLVVTEDVGRHNTLDKIRGACLLEGIPTRDRILLTTGRVSSEMLYKAGALGVPLVASRSSPTTLSVALAHAWHITVVGYVRPNSLRVYTFPERLGLPPVQDVAVEHRSLAWNISSQKVASL